MKRWQLQQGDVNIVKVENFDDIKHGTKKMKTDIIRDGEATGHHHRIVGTDFELYQAEGEQVIARILSGDCRIVHEEHKSIDLPAGDYLFSPTVEYDHFAERARMVRD